MIEGESLASKADPFRDRRNNKAAGTAGNPRRRTVESKHKIAAAGPEV